jgi:hypothetical protein
MLNRHLRLQRGAGKGLKIASIKTADGKPRTLFVVADRATIDTGKLEIPAHIAFGGRKERRARIRNSLPLSKPVGRTPMNPEQRA